MLVPHFCPSYQIMEKNLHQLTDFAEFTDYHKTDYFIKDQMYALKMVYFI